MIFTLHRYIFRELFRVFVLATLALSLMMSMGAMVRPVQKYGVAPEQVFQLMGHFLPITLTFVLPVSALFAASLVYGRFAGDNEFDACRASGISFLTLVYPGLFLGVIVSITTLVLSFHVVPDFIHRAEHTIKANAEQILFRNIQRKGYYSLPDNRFRIFADHGNLESKTLQGVIIVESRQREITQLITAEAARITFETHKNFNEVTIAAKDVCQIDKNGQAYSNLLTLKSSFASLLTDDIKFQRIDDIKRIQADYMHFYPVRNLAYQARARMAVEMLGEQIAAKLADSSYKFAGPDRVVAFSAAGCIPERGNSLALKGPIVLHELDKDLGTLICRWESASGHIELEGHEPGATLDIILDNPTHDRGDYKGIAQRHVIKYLAMPREIETALTDDKLAAALDDLGGPGSPLAAPSSELTQLVKQLKGRIERTLVEIQAEISSRLVFGLGCTLLILTGIALGVIFKGGHLLTAFGASSIPAAVLIICIVAGKAMTKDSSIAMNTGVVVMWTGLGALALLAIVLYRKLLRT